MAAGDAAAQHHDVGGGYPRYASEQHAASAIFLLQAACTHVRGHAACHFRHGRQQGQGSLRTGHCLIGDGDGTRRQEVVGLGAVGRKMQIGEEHLFLPQLLAFLRERLLDLHDEFRACIDFIGARNDFRPHRFVIRIAQPRSNPGTALNDDAVAIGDELARGRRHEPNPVFAVLDFLWYPNEHYAFSGCGHSTNAAGRACPKSLMLSDFEAIGRELM